MRRARRMAALRQRRLLHDQCPRTSRQTNSIFAGVSRHLFRQHFFRRPPRVHQSPDSHHSRLRSQNVGHRFCHSFPFLPYLRPRPHPHPRRCPRHAPVPSSRRSHVSAAPPRLASQRPSRHRRRRSPPRLPRANQLAVLDLHHHRCFSSVFISCQLRYIARFSPHSLARHPLRTHIAYRNASPHAPIAPCKKFILHVFFSA